MNAGEGYEVRLELVQIYVQGSIEPQRRRHGGHNLSDESVQIIEARLGNTESLLADVVNGLIVHLAQRTCE